MLWFWPVWCSSKPCPFSPLFAADPPAGVAAASPNAAVIYWQAFAAMPTLEGEHKTKYEAAIKTTTEPVSDDLQPIVARFDTALRELHRARRGDGLRLEPQLRRWPPVAVAALAEGPRVEPGGPAASPPAVCGQGYGRCGCGRCRRPENGPRLRQ